ncbi:hypothetical protein D3C78_1592720 [compost metagenome]
MIHDVVDAVIAIVRNPHQLLGRTFMVVIQEQTDQPVPDCDLVVGERCGTKQVMGLVGGGHLGHGTEEGVVLVELGHPF